MRRWLWLGLAGVAAATVALSLLALPKGPEWTSSSPEAVKELEAGFDAQMKLYNDEAARHFQRALELDPDFVMAKMALPETKMGEGVARGEALMADLAGVDASRLSEREQLLLERFRLYRAKKSEEADALVDAYLEKHPDDPFVLHQKAMQLWARGDFERAERLNRHLVEIAPNWVIAYNQLGYITMMRERFTEAREYFVSYRFIAPDQANPYDSLGELHMIQGEYAEALSLFQQAVAIRVDFLASWEHQVLALAMMGRDAEVDQLLADLEGRDYVPTSWLEAQRCFVETERLARREQLAELVARVDGPCLDKPWQGYATIATHQAAVRLGDLELARRLETAAQEMLDKALAERGPVRAMWMNEVDGGLAHMIGVRLAVEGDLAGAAASLRRADELLMYTTAGQGLLKVLNRLVLVETLLAAGNEVEAHRVLAQARSVNPTMVTEFEEDGLQILGLRRR